MLENLRLLLANWLLPKGFQIAMPGAEFLAPLDQDQHRFVITTDGRYLKHGCNMHCVKHAKGWVSFEGETPLCPWCRDDVFKEVAQKVKELPPLPQRPPFVEQPIDKDRMVQVLRSANRGRR